MSIALLLALVSGTAGAPDFGTACSAGRVESAVEAVVALDLRSIRVAVESTFVPARSSAVISIILAADRFAKPPDLPAALERNLFPKGHALGGFFEVEASAAGQPCAREPGRMVCRGSFVADQPVAISVNATLSVPERYGPFGLHQHQLTLGAGWYPYVAEPKEAPPCGSHRVRVQIPAHRAAVLGEKLFSAQKSGQLIETHQASTQVPLVLFSTSAKTSEAAGGRAVVIASGDRPALVAALQDGLRFLHEEGLPLPSRAAPLVVVEAPLRHNLARASTGPLLVSDRAFRLFPVERFLLFHRFPILRELFTLLMLREKSESEHIAADALGAWLEDRYVLSRFGSAEDAFDVLEMWAFIPTVDSMLYAPQLPFIGAYFSLIKEEDPHRQNLIDFPQALPRGKILYEKLLDRLGQQETDRLFVRIARGEQLNALLEERLGEEAATFLATWLGPYPSVQYRLGEVNETTCGPACFEAKAVIEREGAEIAEPVSVLFIDEDGNERVVASPASPERRRVVTATMSASLDEVVVDPHGRLAETPTAEVPSPKFDNRSDPEWRILLNNFNLLLSPTAGTIDTALDLGLSRIRDVEWSFGVRADISPETLALTGRGSRYFGSSVTPDRLEQWIGIASAIEYLRPNFAGVADDGMAFSVAGYYGFDNRQSYWAPDPGFAARLVVDYTRVIGDITGDLTANAVAVSGRVLHSWRFGAAHQVSLRGSFGAYVAGSPRAQLLFSLGGRRNVRGYRFDDEVGKVRALASAEWVHSLLSDMNVDGWIAWVNGLDGALFSDVALIGDDLDAYHTPRADVGYGFRIYIDYFGVKPSVMAIDVAFPLVDVTTGRAKLGPPAVYIDFAQSFLVF